jgi:hypothetical protein
MACAGARGFTPRPLHFNFMLANEIVTARRRRVGLVAI